MAIAKYHVAVSYNKRYRASSREHESNQNKHSINHGDLSPATSGGFGSVFQWPQVIRSQSRPESE